jgi:predicted nicotinamide N-methyase
MDHLFGGAPLLLPSSGTVRCGEVVNGNDNAKGVDEDLPVDFVCTLFPTRLGDDGKHGTLSLYFGCRRPSFDAVLTEHEQKVGKDEFDDSTVDPNFFDPGYTLAGSTGFCVWAGARFLLEALTSMADVHDLASARILELGAGVGMLGTALAALGAQVILTDLATLVDNAIVPNLERNMTISVPTHRDPPNWLQDTATDTVYPIGRGWAMAHSLDWTKSLGDQLPKATRQAIDVVVASDCTWLSSMLVHFFDTLEALFRNGASKCLLSFQRRDCNVGSAIFTTADMLLEEIQGRRGWTMRPLAWRPLPQSDGSVTAVYLIEIRPSA